MTLQCLSRVLQHRAKTPISACETQWLVSASRHTLLVATTGSFFIGVGTVALLGTPPHLG
ncbi:hypothetical protein ABH927_003100 [Planotetraspora sp. GP83]